MRPKQFNIDLNDVDDDGVFADQTLGGAGSFTLNGAGISGGVWTSSDGFAKKIGFTSTGDISAVTFTVTGYLQKGNGILVTETLAGPNNNTVETTNYFYSITSVTAGAAVGTNTKAGPVDEAMVIHPLNWRAGIIALDFIVTGTISYTIQQTFDELTQANYPFDWQNHDDPSLVGATTSQTGNYEAIPRAIRILINSYSSGAALQATIIQQDV
jgi:hypothetical protein